MAPDTPLMSASALQRYLALLYPEAPDDAWLVVSWLAGPQDFRSRWFRLADAEEATAWLTHLAATCNTYVGLGLRHPACLPTPGTRGASTDVCAIGGLWVELDHNAGVHRATHLPTPEELTAFVATLPCPCSLVIDSGGGLHCYLLFREVWLLDTLEEQAAAALLLRRWQRTVQIAASARGWHVDSTADLARVLRPPGTYNYKEGTPRPVHIVTDDPRRYNPSDLADAPWMATIDDTYTPPQGSRTFPLVPLEPLTQGCAWLRHCRDDAATLTEPEWYAMLGVLGRCADGPSLAHAWSSPYPRYTVKETTAKLTHALAAAGPRTCAGIRYDLGGEPWCRVCPSWGTVKSPIVLGLPRTAPPTPLGWSVSGVNGASIAAEADIPWHKTLFGKKNGELTQNAYNIGQILRHHPYWQAPERALWCDVIRGYAMCGPRQITKTLAVHCTEWFGQEMRLPISNLDLLKSCLEAQAETQPVDLLQRWLHALPAWDQTPRLATWFARVTGALDSPYTREISRRLPVSMVARALDPGCPYREVVILEGKENIGKSHLVEALSATEWYTTLSMKLEGKDSHIMLHKYWLAEFSELDAMSSTDEARLKAFITMEHDTYVPKYSNASVSIPRRTIFVGTTNDGTGYLKGQTGNTRYLPIRVGSHIDVEYFRTIREQLFAEALQAYYATPDTWWCMPSEVVVQATEEREMRRVESGYEQPLHEWLEYTRLTRDVFQDNQRVVFTPNETTWPEIARWFLGIETPERWKDKALQMQIATALKAIGWQSVQIWRLGRKTRIWQKMPEHSTTTNDPFLPS